MGDSPKIIEEKLRMILTGWKTLARDKVFGGMTYEQFEAFVQPSFDARQQLEVLDDQRTNLMTTRDTADDASMAKTGQIIAGIESHPEFGNNSALWEAVGRTRKSERASGLTRKGGKGDKHDGSPPPAL
jgi:hypothetical protein